VSRSRLPVLVTTTGNHGNGSIRCAAGTRIGQDDDALDAARHTTRAIDGSSDDGVDVADSRPAPTAHPAPSRANSVRRPVRSPVRTRIVRGSAYWTAQHLFEGQCYVAATAVQLVNLVRQH
jgi:hypothetical protein